MKKTVSSCGGVKPNAKDDVKSPAQLAKEKKKTNNSKGKK